MITCKTCGAECQNPTDRYGETFLNWINIHSQANFHKLFDKDSTEEERKELQDTINEIKAYYAKFHDKNGNRIEGLMKRRRRK